MFGNSVPKNKYAQMKFIGNTQEYLHLETIASGQNCHILTETIESSLTILWFEDNGNELLIDGKKQAFNKNQIVFLTEFHHVEVGCLSNTRFLRFNRPFYCIFDHDADIGCKGLLFFGASELPIIHIPETEKETFEILWKMFTIEMLSNDSLQIDMLQTMLKRYLILCARIYKTQKILSDDITKLDLIREFNFLVEQHFKTKHTVAEYADLMNRSPKTLSNIFSKSGFKTPLQYIQERKMLEARRLLRYSDKQIKEIAFELGYEEIQAFSRFFKKYEHVSPSEFKENT